MTGDKRNHIKGTKNIPSGIVPECKWYNRRQANRQLRHLSRHLLHLDIYELPIISKGACD